MFTTQSRLDSHRNLGQLFLQDLGSRSLSVRLFRRLSSCLLGRIQSIGKRFLGCSTKLLFRCQLGLQVFGLLTGLIDPPCCKIFDRSGVFLRLV